MQQNKNKRTDSLLRLQSYRELPFAYADPRKPLRLGVAAALAFPDGSMTASGLRREVAKGRLTIERIAGKDYTTLHNIEEMRESCRVRAKGHDSTCAGPDPVSVEKQFGSSATVNGISPRDALEARLTKARQKGHSKP